jgi:hypothetical protein
LAAVEEIIIFVEGNKLHVELKVGERGKHIRDANTNIARRNDNIIMSTFMLQNKGARENEIVITSVKANGRSRSVNAKK